MRVNSTIWREKYVRIFQQTMDPLSSSFCDGLGIAAPIGGRHMDYFLFL